MNPIKHTYKSIVTTIVGFAITGITLWNVYQTHSAWTEALWGIAIGLGLLFSPDDILQRLKKLLNPSP